MSGSRSVLTLPMVPQVVRTALVDSSSVAALMTTTEAMVTDLPKEESKCLCVCVS